MIKTLNSCFSSDKLTVSKYWGQEIHSKWKFCGQKRGATQLIETFVRVSICCSCIYLSNATAVNWDFCKHRYKEKIFLARLWYWFVVHDHQPFIYLRNLISCRISCILPGAPKNVYNFRYTNLLLLRSFTYIFDGSLFIFGKGIKLCIVVVLYFSLWECE